MFRDVAFVPDSLRITVGALGTITGCDAASATTTSREVGAGVAEILRLVTIIAVINFVTATVIGKGFIPGAAAADEIPNQHKRRCCEAKRPFAENKNPVDEVSQAIYGVGEVRAVKQTTVVAVTITVTVTISVIVPVVCFASAGAAIDVINDASIKQRTATARWSVGAIAVESGSATTRDGKREQKDNTNNSCSFHLNH
jgi:hypothetical protein